jgi:triosephosphate isomerase
MKSSGKLIVMNWKCNPASVSESLGLASTSDASNVVICPPAAFLDIVGKNIHDASLGAQDGYWSEGAWTGEYSFRQLRSIGVKYAIVGHSERRLFFGETSESVSKKTAAALASGISPVVCVGEKKRANLSSAIKTVISQLEGSLADIPKDRAGKVILAYEPIWAISTAVKGARNASLAEMEPVMIAMAEEFRKVFDVKAKVLYGGSVNPDNAGIYASCPSVQGVLVGGASVDKKKAAAVIRLMKAK